MPVSRPIRAALTAVIAATLALGGTAAADAAPAVSADVQVHVASSRFLHAPRPTISGKHKVGARLTAHVGAWRPSPVRFKYRWKANGSSITGATHRTFRVRKVDAGKRITVSVTAKKVGYRTTTRTSKAVRITRPVAGIAIRGDGQYRVGSGVQPGTYVTTGSPSYCYWERVSSFDGSLSSILANDIGPGQRIITIAPGDYGVSFQRCGSWIRASRATRPAAIKQGVYLVGSQLSPGEYTAPNSGGDCYWETMSGFSGSTDDIIANDFVSSGRVVVDIPDSAVGFSSERCGTWTKIG